jgi:pimeloyl-ACP methyl ester carboxylesterase
VASIRSAPAAILDDLGTAADVPALDLYGQNDIYGPSIGAVPRRLQSAQHEVLDGAGHLPWLQAADRFYALLDQFYDRVCHDTTPHVRGPRSSSPAGRLTANGSWTSL